MYSVVEMNFYKTISDGTSILGSSNMCTRYWTGILSVFDSPDDLADSTKCRSSIEFEGGLSCARFVTGSKVGFSMHIHLTLGKI